MSPSLRVLPIVLLCGGFFQTTWSFNQPTHLHRGLRIKLNAEETVTLTALQQKAYGEPAVRKLTDSAKGGETAPVVESSSTEIEIIPFDAKTLPGITAPLGFFDPAGLSGEADAMTVFWYRSAELKHGRIAMLATVGWLLNEFGVFWPGAIDNDGLKFADLGTNPLAAWDAIPLNGQLQVWLAIGLIEISDPMSTALLTEDCSPMLDGGKTGLQFDPAGFASRMDPEKMLAKQNTELNNGRLAMIGIISFFTAANYANTVPLLTSMFEK